jgi:hypothetical protein
MKPISQSSTQEVLAGLVERVTFHNPESGFCVLRAKARAHRDLVTVVGHAAIISAGMDHPLRRMDQRSRPRSAVQGAISQDLGAAGWPSASLTSRCDHASPTPQLW